MRSPHTKTIVFVLLISSSIVGAGLSFWLATTQHSLLPAPRSQHQWTARTISDSEMGGASHIALKDSDYALDFDYQITPQLAYPYVISVLDFDHKEQASSYVDLSHYQTVSFDIKCQHTNMLSFNVATFDATVTKPSEFPTFKIVSHLFNCENKWQTIEVDLHHIPAPRWWLESFNMPLSDQSYNLKKTRALTFGASRHGPMNLVTNVKVSQLQLNGFKWPVIYAYIVILVVGWLVYAVWALRGFVRRIRQNTLPSHVGLPQAVELLPYRAKEKQQLITFLDAQYRNGELSLAYTASTLGINRNKVNDILKQEFGQTFSSYLNWLRLDEAARLLSSNDNVNISEVALYVGYKNVSYFNRLFKETYQCTPKVYKTKHIKAQSTISQL
ncbi:helix-turn-helix domain-containing protein [Saccharophagus degradans]|uniref:Transcriptional regulator, AraC family n=1 Tax=Saccharophagus degradans (strain 2-40 / ATCC 43961 / DSM 17024) TaxID=203122 RepID=Q21EL1_SACD2|nr:helix-turn-helix domain-containing protein [Saccharophagus degradans]ABD82868.1 transcriptional regulator, AraC family [Saccharophagus degradans 2-40]